MQTYKTYRTEEEASIDCDLLSENAIPYELRELSKLTDIIFTGGTGLEDKFAIMIESSNFKRVDEIIENRSKEDPLNLEEDHYLLSFTDEELLEILMKPDEWSKADFHSAKALLKQKGKSVSEDLISAMRNSRIKELSKQEEGKLAWILLGYISACLGGLIGIFIGFNYMNSKHKLPNGKKVLSYTPRTRTHGLIIFGIGMSVMIIFSLNYLFEFIHFF